MVTLYISSCSLGLHCVHDFPPSLPLIFRHNDLPWNIRKFVHNKLDTVNFTHNLKYVDPWSKSKWSHTDIVRLKEGLVGCQVSTNS